VEREEGEGEVDGARGVIVAAPPGTMRGGARRNSQSPQDYGGDRGK